MKNRIAVLLHNVRSTHNVGSIFRTSEAAGVEKIFLSGFTPAPVDRFGRVQKDIQKTALGAEKMLPWEKVASPSVILRRLKREGWNIVGVEQDTRAIHYRKLRVSKPTLFILGNEVRGLSRSMRDSCDALIEIPMHGKMVRQAHHSRYTKRGKESLNVSVAAGIILFAFPRS